MAMFPGERMTEGGCPLLAHESGPTSATRLVVFLPGALHLARIAYGHPEAEPADFLAHWLSEAGWAFLGCSYPVAPSDLVFSTIDPLLDLSDVVTAVADETADVVERRGLSPEVVVAAWSALGNSAPGLAAEFDRRGLHLSTFVSLAATPPLPNLILGSLDATTEAVGSSAAFGTEGLLRHNSLRSESFLAELDRIDADEGRVVISRNDYFDHYMGDMALNVFPGLEAHVIADGRVEVGHGRPLEVSRGSRWELYPLTAAVVPTLASDRRHVLTDRHNWAMINANAVQWRLLSGLDATAVTPDHWRRITEHADELCTELHQTVDGGHFFFLGERGARATAVAIVELDARRATLEHRLEAAVAEAGDRTLR